MRKYLLVFLALISWPVMGQGILWQTYVRDNLPLYQRGGGSQIDGGSLGTAILHPNGGLLAIGSSFYLSRRTSDNQIVPGATAVRISSSGDSLNIQPVPGAVSQLTPGVARPVLLRNNPALDYFLAIIPRDTLLHQTSTTKNQLLVRLDTSGFMLDTMELFLNATGHAAFYIHDAAFVTPHRILISGGSFMITPVGPAITTEAAIIAWPEGLVIWRHSFIFNLPYSGTAQISQFGPNAIYLTGGSDSSLVAVRIDTLGNQTGYFDLFTLDSGQSVAGRAMPLPHGKFGYQISWNEQTLSGMARTPGSGIGVVDTAGHEDYRIHVSQPVNSNYYRVYENLVGANDDGSLLVAVTHRGPLHDTLFLERYSATGQQQAQWAVSSPGRRIDFINDAVYLGNDKAYIVGASGFDYWAAYLDGTGNAYDPTETRGPRESASLQAVLYPNPASDRLFIQSDKELAYCILNLKGEVVREGSVSREHPVDVSALPPGLYQMLLSGKGQSVRKRFVKL